MSHSLERHEAAVCWGRRPVCIPIRLGSFSASVSKRGGGALEACLFLEEMPLSLKRKAETLCLLGGRGLERRRNGGN